MMSTSSANSIPPISIGESGGKVVIFTIELPRGQPLSPVFTNLDIVAGLVCKCTTAEAIVVQRVDKKHFVSFHSR